MLPACGSFTIADEAARFGDADPPREGGGHFYRHLGRIGEEGAEKPHRPELHGEAEAHVIPSAATDHRQIGVVEMEMAIKLFLRRDAVEAAVAPLLFGRQKPDRHPAITMPSRRRSSRHGQAYRSACFGRYRRFGKPPPCSHHLRERQ